MAFLNSVVAFLGGHAALEDLRGFLVEVVVEVQVPERDVRLREARVGLDGAAEGLIGLLGMVEDLAHEPEPPPGLEELRVGRRGRRERLLGLVQLLELEVRLAEVVLEVRVVGRVRHGLLERVDGLVPLALLLEDLAEVVVRDVVRRVRLDGLLEVLLGRVVEVVLELVGALVGELDGLDALLAAHEALARRQDARDHEEDRERIQELTLSSCSRHDHSPPPAGVRTKGYETMTMPPPRGFGNSHRRTAWTVQFSTRALLIVEFWSTDAMT